MNEQQLVSQAESAVNSAVMSIRMAMQEIEKIRYMLKPSDPTYMYIDQAYQAIKKVFEESRS